MIDYIEDDLSAYNVGIESTYYNADYDDCEQFDIENEQPQTDILFE